jgi:2-polyprenyl-6-methoxyphenol hydroxylase-like FAD-dependent oxidoreductase
MTEHRVDVCVVGAGVAGIACAQGMARRGASVVLLDRLHPMPDNLKAEKLSGEAVPPMIRLGFEPAVASALTPLYNVAVYFGEHRLGTRQLDPPEAGTLYFRLINTMREHLDPRISFQPGKKASAINQLSDGAEVVTDKDTRIECKLVVLATGDAHQLLEGMGGVYAPRFPNHVFAAAFDMEGTLSDGHGTYDSQTFHHPIEDGPVAYATFFRLGEALRGNIFCPGVVSEEWQRDLKQKPLEVLAGHSRVLGTASKSWRRTSSVMIRKLNVTRLQPPAVPHIVALGDAAHTIDPAGGGGLTFALLETELLLECFASRWLDEGNCSAEAISAFYDDPRRTKAIHRFFGAGEYMFALNHDSSLKGDWRRLKFALQYMMDSRHAGHLVPSTGRSGTPWQSPAHFLYE